MATGDKGIRELRKHRQTSGCGPRPLGRGYYVAAKSVEEALYLLGGIVRSEGATVVEHDPPDEAPRSQIPAVVHPAQVDRKLGLRGKWKRDIQKALREMQKRMKRIDKLGGADRDYWDDIVLAFEERLLK